MAPSTDSQTKLVLGAAAFAVVGAIALKLCKRRDEITALIGKRKQYWHHPFSKESYKKACAFKPRPTDVFILTPPKTGTTWLQQICHQLRTGGDMNFEDIYQVSPWAMLAWDLDISLDAEHVANPRLFKTHQRLSAINRGAKYLVTVRDPAKTVVSWYSFLREKKVPAVLKYKNVSEFCHDEDFFAENMRFGATLWEYYLEFYQCRHLENVLVIVYEDMLKNTAAHIQVIAQFLGLSKEQITPELIDTVTKMAGLEFMLQPEVVAKFDESWTYKRLQEVGRIDDHTGFAPTPRVTKGHSGDIFKLDAEAHDFMQAKWEGTITARTGLLNYKEMVDELRAAMPWERI